MNIKVVNKKNLNPELGWVDFYIGRPSVLGNPFVLKNESKRDFVISEYRKWLWGEINKPDSKVRNELFKLASRVKNKEKIRLVCFCNPLPCHGDVIIKAVNWLIKSDLM
jgi:hypothetical protein